ncbi:MAG TPA: DUF2721 domain-containing protein [Vampirovibrionales bacterium]
MDLTTPAVLLSTISLLLLAYTNRFLALAKLIRELHDNYAENPEDGILTQLDNLRFRIKLIRDMQTIGVLSILFFVLSMFLIFMQHAFAAKCVFGSGLVLLMVSLVLSAWETYISTNALQIELSDLGG